MLQRKLQLARVKKGAHGIYFKYKNTNKLLWLLLAAYSHVVTTADGSAHLSDFYFIFKHAGHNAPRNVCQSLKVGIFGMSGERVNHYILNLHSNITVQAPQLKLAY